MFEKIIRIVSEVILSSGEIFIKKIDAASTNVIFKNLWW